MFVENNDIQSWANDLKEYDFKRKTNQWVSGDWPKHVTFKEVKAKDIEYNPILQKYTNLNNEKAVNEKEKLFRDSMTLKKLALTSKFAQDVDIVTLQKYDYGTLHPDDKRKQKVIPAFQVDYNIINNEKVQDDYFKNVKFNVPIIKKTKETRIREWNPREFSIVSNEYRHNHDERFANEQEKKKKIAEEKFMKTHTYNPLVGEYYDQNKEKEFLNEREQKKLTHGKNWDDRLPPCIRNREPVIFNEKEITNAARMLDLQKKNSKKRYELKYLIENEIKDNDYPNQLIDTLHRTNRMNPKKYYEEFEKGFDTITLGKTKLELYKKHTKPVYSSWDSIAMNSNEGSELFTSLNAQLSEQKSVEREINGEISERIDQILKKSKSTVGLIANDKFIQSELSNEKNMRGNHILPQVKGINDKISKQSDLIENVKTANDYDKYCVPPKFHHEEYEHTRTLPHISSNESKFNFKLLQTGGFNLTATQSLLIH